jgi:hypothetical protein
LPQNIPNDLKCTFTWLSKIYQSWNFGHENIPSVNPDWHLKTTYR